MAMIVPKPLNGVVLTGSLRSFNYPMQHLACCSDVAKPYPKKNLSETSVRTSLAAHLRPQLAAGNHDPATKLHQLWSPLDENASVAASAKAMPALPPGNAIKTFLKRPGNSANALPRFVPTSSGEL